MKRNVLYFLLLLLPYLSVAQELNCRVEVNSDQIQGTNKEVFTTLKEAITEYINVENGLRPKFRRSNG